MQDLRVSAPPINRHYDTTIHELVNHSREQIPEEVVQPKENKGWFGWVWGGAEAGPADAINAKRSEIKALEGKLTELEDKATVAEIDGAKAKGGIKVLSQQRNLAIRELMVEVKLAIVKELLEEYALKFGRGSTEFREMEVKVKAFEARIQDEGKELLHQEAKFWGLRKLYDEIQGERNRLKPPVSVASEERSLHNFVMALGPGEVEEVDDLEPHSVEASRAAIVNELKLENVGKLSETLSKTEKLELEIEQLTEEVDRITTVINHRGQLDEVGMALSNDELAGLKLELFDEKIKLKEKQAELMRAQQDKLIADYPRLQNEIEFVEMELNELDLGFDEVGHSGRTKAQLQQAIVDLKQAQADAAAESTALGRDLAAIPKAIRDLKMEKVAQEDVNKIAPRQDRNMLSNALEAGMNIVGKAVGVGAVNQPNVKYKWENSDWGKLIAGQKSKFRDSMNKLKRDVATLEAQLKVQQNSLELAQARLQGEHYLQPAVWQAEGIEAGEEPAPLVLERRWRNEIAALEAQIKTTKATLDDSRVALHAAFLNQIISATTSKQIERKKVIETLKGVEAQIIAMNAQKTQSADLIPHLDDEDRGAAEIRLQLQQKTFDDLRLRAQEMQNKIAQLDTELDALDAGFRSQHQKYSSQQLGQRGIMSHMTKYATDTLKEVATLGWVRTKYVTPQEFEVNKQFADFGYTWQEGLSKFTDIQAGKEATYFTDQVKSFLSFADKHPEIARALVMDIAITCACLADQSAYNTLLTGLRARGYTQAMLGSLGRNVEVPPKLTPETYPEAAKWKALGDFANNGPRVAQGAKNAITAVGAGLMEGNLFKAAIGGVTAGYTGAAQATLVQKIATDMPNEAVIGAVGVLRVLNGDEPMKVLEEQRNLAVLSLAGNIRRGITAPKTALTGIRRIFSDNWKAFKKAGLIEKTLRIGVVVGLPVLGIGGAVAAVVFGGPLGIAAIVTLAIVSIFTGLSAGALVAGLLNRIPGFRSSMQAARVDAAREMVRKGEWPNKIRMERDNYVKGLKDKGKLLTVRKRPGEPKLLAAWRQDEALMRTLEKPLLERLEESYKISSDAVGQNLTSKDIKDLFLRIVGEDQLRQAVNAYIDSHPEASKLKAEDKKKLQLGMMESLQERFVTSWLKPQLDVGFENEVVNAIMQYESPEQFDAATAQARENVRVKEQELFQALDSEISEKLGPQNAADKPYVSAAIRKEFGYSYDPAALGQAAAPAA